MLPTYSTGTASVAAGGTVVTGTGTIWSGINAKQGDWIVIGGFAAALITEVTDDTHLKIPPWPGAAQSNVAYTIYQNYVGRVVGVAAAEDVGDMLERLRDQAPIYNVPDDETAPDPSYGTDGQWAYQVSTGTWWVKSGGVWVITSGPTGVPEAPSDGTTYGRKNAAWVAIIGAVSSVFGRTGAVVAVAGDYDVAKITGAAPLASPAFSGNPTAPTPAVDDNDTSLATTAFVIGQAGGANPVMNGAAAPGVATRWARQDHVHPIDTSRAPLASPIFTGDPRAPTPATGDNDTSIATTAFVVARSRFTLTGFTQVFVKTPANGGNDANDGLTSGTAKATMQAAMDLIASWDMRTFAVQMMVGAGSYAGFSLKQCTPGSGGVIITGDSATPGNCIISSASTYAIGSVPGPTSFQIDGFRVLNTGSLSDVNVDNANVSLSNFEWAGTSNNHRMWCGGGKVTFGGTQKILTGGITWALSDTTGRVFLDSLTVTIGANVTFTNFVQSRNNSYFESAGATFNLGGFTVTGTRYDARNSSGFNGTGGGASYFPGTIAGVKDTTSYYV